MSTEDAGRRTALITGASAGIGTELARVFARAGWDLVLTARRAERLEAVAAEITRAHGVSADCLPADLSDPAAPRALFDRTEGRGRTIDALVNNAGYGVPGAFADTGWEDYRALLQVLGTAPIELTHLFTAPMRQRGYGRILQIASLAGLMPGYPGAVLYGPVKAMIIKFAQGVHAELSAEGIHCCAVCPGFTMTEFHDANGTRADADKIPGFMWMDAPTVAQQSYDAVMAGKSIYVNGALNRALAGLVRVLPDTLSTRLAGQRPNAPEN